MLGPESQARSAEMPAPSAKLGEIAVIARPPTPTSQAGCRPWPALGRSGSVVLDVGATSGGAPTGGLSASAGTSTSESTSALQAWPTTPIQARLPSGPAAAT